MHISRNIVSEAQCNN